MSQVVEVTESVEIETSKNIAVRKPQDKKIKKNIAKPNYRGTVKKKKRISLINSDQLGASNQRKS